MFSCEIILSMLNFCSITQKYVMVILPLVYKKKFTCRGENSSNKSSNKIRMVLSGSALASLQECHDKLYATCI